MGFFKKLFQFRNRERNQVDWEDGYEDTDWENETIRREDLDLSYSVHREKYVRSLVEQMKDASQELDQLSHEYNVVTAYLTDMEEIDALPEEQRNEVTDYAKRIGYLDNEKSVYQRKPCKITDLQFSQMEVMGDEIADNIKKMRETEEYQLLIKQDLKKLESEKQAYEFCKNEAVVTMGNVRGMLMISVVTMGICAVMLLVLQFAFQMKVQVGYLFTVCAAAVILTYIYLRFSEATKEKFRSENAINQIILLQNKVKIRYVNNTNLLDYLYVKYGVMSARELEYVWEEYQSERVEREKFRQTLEDLDYYEKELIRILRRYQVRDPHIWIHQAEALVNRNEMVELRHGFIVRRQKLRKQMEYNKNLATSAQTEIKEVMEQYPESAKKIMEIVAEYEKKSK